MTMKTDIFLDEDNNHLNLEIKMFERGVVVLKQSGDDIFMSTDQALGVANMIIREHALQTVKHETKDTGSIEHWYTLNEGDHWNEVKVRIDYEHDSGFLSYRGSSSSGAGVKEYLSKLKVVLNAIKEL